MSFDLLLIGPKIVFILGIINIILLILVFLSCRCVLGNKIFTKLMQKEWYRKFYNFHCSLWWIFFATVILHTILAFIIFGNPF